jgi:hypothetical protein
MQIFNTFDQLEKALPKVAGLVQAENKMQYPDAKFIKGAHGNYYSEPEDGIENDDVIILFDVGDPNQLLYCWLGSSIDNKSSTIENDPFIDEYCLHPTDWAMDELEQVK